MAHQISLDWIKTLKSLVVHVNFSLKFLSYSLFLSYYLDASLDNSRDIDLKFFVWDLRMVSYTISKL